MKQGCAFTMGEPTQKERVRTKLDGVAIDATRKFIKACKRLKDSFPKGFTLENADEASDTVKELKNEARTAFVFVDICRKLNEEIADDTEAVEALASTESNKINGVLGKLSLEIREESDVEENSNEWKTKFLFAFRQTKDNDSNAHDFAKVAKFPIAHIREVLQLWESVIGQFKIFAENKLLSEDPAVDCWSDTPKIVFRALADVKQELRKLKVTLHKLQVKAGNHTGFLKAFIAFPGLIEPKTETGRLDNLLKSSKMGEMVKPLIDSLDMEVSNLMSETVSRRIYAFCTCKTSGLQKPGFCKHCLFSFVSCAWCCVNQRGLPPKIRKQGNAGTHINRWLYLNKRHNQKVAQAIEVMREDVAAIMIGIITVTMVNLIIPLVVSGLIPGTTESVNETLSAIAATLAVPSAVSPSALGFVSSTATGIIGIISIEDPGIANTQVLIGFLIVLSYFSRVNDRLIVLVLQILIIHFIYIYFMVDEFKGWSDSLILPVLLFIGSVFFLVAALCRLGKAEIVRMLMGALLLTSAQAFVSGLLLLIRKPADNRITILLISPALALLGRVSNAAIDANNAYKFIRAEQLLDDWVEELFPDVESDVESGSQRLKRLYQHQQDRAVDEMLRRFMAASTLNLGQLKRAMDEVAKDKERHPLYNEILKVAKDGNPNESVNPIATASTQTSGF